jgi:3,4-dihydroxy 2-butanone 4-phosphate synthase/GTP cyclohydrolase II
VRIHSECLTGDVFGSRRCDCGLQLDLALATIAAAGRGVVVYLRGHEGRGIGLSHKLRAYQLQDAGFDTVDANVQLGFPVDMRDYGAALAILADLGVYRLRLMTNNPDKVRRLSQAPFSVVERVPLLVGADDESRRYLQTKRDRLGHYLD